MIDIINKSDCCGCTACASICVHNAIAMIADSEGFKYPEINKYLCVDCGLCDNICPIINRDKTERKKTYQSIYAVRHNDNDVLFSSSSGGAFMGVAEYVISNGGAVVGVEYSQEMEVRHAFAYTILECERFKGSKYVQSNIEGIYPRIKNYLRTGGLLLFTGTPCQVDGLKKYLRKDCQNLITLDLVCHAVPSPKIFKEYISYASSVLKEDIVGLNMRDKKNDGWSHHFSYRFLFKNGKYIVDSPLISNWGRIYFSQYINRPSCHYCRYTNLDRVGDITIADYWDDGNKRPELHSKVGTSLFMINTEKGLNIFCKVRCNFKKWLLSEEQSIQPCLERPTKVNLNRNKFWKYYERYGFKKSYFYFFTDGKYVKIKKRVKAVLKDSFMFFSNK